MIVEPRKISESQLYGLMTRLIVPRPIAWVSTRSLSGIDNLAPYSYFNAVGTVPPTLMFCPANKADGSKKDTLRNIEETGQFAVNIVSLPLLEAMNQSSAEYSAAESEFTAIGIDASNCDRIAVKRVTAARAVFECELHTLLGLGTGPGGANMVIGRIVAIHLDDAMLDSDGWPEHSQLAAVGRLGGTSYATTQDRMELARPKLGRAQS